ncbi:MAG: quinol:electron acceptor oxidoreductase subunit ActD [Syntrophorhabdaceae bacterium]
MNKDEAIFAVFPYVDEFLACLKILKEEKLHIIEAFSPVRLPEMQEIMTPKPSLTRTFTLAGGIIGAIGIVALACYAHLSFRLIVYGKPVLAWVPWVLVAFEGTILFASLCAFVSWVFKAGLPRPDTDPGYNAALSGHQFGVIVSARQGDEKRIEELLKKNGAEEVSRVTA